MKFILYALSLLKKLHVHSWGVLDYERKDHEFYRKVKFRICPRCNTIQEYRCGEWGRVANYESLKEAIQFQEEQGLETRILCRVLESFEW